MRFGPWAGIGWIPAVTSMALSLGCGGLIHRVEPDPDPAVKVPDRWTAAYRVAEGGGADRWWEAFRADELNRHVTTALGANFDLVQAFARLEQAEAAKNGAFSGFLPTVTARAQYGGTRIVQPFLDRSIDAGQFDLGPALSYELDVWGRVAQAHAAEVENLRATRFDVAAAHLTVAASVVETWLRAVEQQAVLALLRRQLETSRTFLELTELRFDQGIASGLDVFQQRSQVAAVEARFPPVRAAEAVAEHQLAVLLGRAPGSLQVERDALPELPPFPEVGLPSTVLLRRPDVQAARHRAVAQDHRIGAAIAEYFPRFTLDASLGWRSFNGFEGLFDDFIYTVAGQLGATLFQGGRRKAEVRRNRALLEERLGAFAQQVLVALREVEDALVEQREQVRLVARLDRQVDAARATLAEARLRYVNGLSDFLPVLTALQGLQDVERQRVAAQRELLARRVRLHRALGGTWQEDRIERRLSGERAS
jgi:outer membrane protein, multidrug efflux system